MWELREREATDLRDVTILEVPVVFTGTADECRQYAEGRGFHWKPITPLLFGGYFANDNGDVLYPS